MSQFALQDLKVLDCATLFAGPLAATILGDYGADVLKIEHPRGDAARTHGPSKDGVGLWWKMLARNKRSLALDLGSPAGRDVFLKLVESADVVIENFRPGTFERWGLSPEELQKRNERLIIARVTGFGQFGPAAKRPGFGTLAEAMSGFAAMTGEADGPPTLPPFGLADGISALAVAIAVLTALQSRNNSGRGQVIDLAIIEPILTILGAQPMIFDQLGVVQTRTGNRSLNNAPRNTYLCSDGRWVAVSTSSTAIAERVMRLVGHPEVVAEPWFGSGFERAKHADLLDGYVSDWIATRTRDDVLSAFERAEAAIAPIYDISDVFEDPQFQALDTITTVDDEDFGPLRMQNVLFRLSDTPGSIRWTGRALGANTDEVLQQHGYNDAEVADMRAKGVVA